jgi:hypothetical protein
MSKYASEEGKTKGRGGEGRKLRKQSKIRNMPLLEKKEKKTKSKFITLNK